MSFFHALLSGTGLNPGGGVDYYVSASGTGNGLSSATPMSQADFILVTLEEFDRVFFNRGDTFEWPEYNVTTANVTFGAFGSGANPIFLGSEDVSSLSWSVVSGDLWSASLATQPNWLTKNGTSGPLATSAFLVCYTFAPLGSTLIDGDPAVINAAFPGSLVGAKLRIIESRWLMSFEYNIDSYNSTTGDITLSSPLAANVEAGATFLIYGQTQFLNLADEWWYDDPNNLLYYYSSANPNTLDIRGMFNQYAFNLEADGVTFENLDFREYYFAGVQALDNEAHNATFENCSFEDIKNYGIYAVNCDGFSITDNNFERLTTGIARIGDNWTVENNDFDYMGMDVTYPFPIGSYQLTGCAILLTSDNAIIRRNTITNTAYCGMVITGFDMLVERNDISAHMARFDDGGGIYTAGSSTSVDTNMDGIIRLNHIHDNTVHTSYPQSTIVTGVYIDHHTAGYTVDENSVYGLRGTAAAVIPDVINGVYVNWDTENISVTDNIIRGGNAGIRFNGSASLSVLYSNTGNTVTGNKIAATADDRICIELIDYEGNGSFNPFTGGNIDNNNYMSPYNASVARRRSTSTGSPTNYTLAAWQSHISDEASSTAINNTLLYTTPAAALGEVLMSVNETESTDVVSIGSNYTDEVNSSTSSRSIPDYSSAISISTVKRNVLFLEDTFTGSSGNITGHTPDTGPAWTVETGTISLNGSGQVGASVTGEMWVNAGQSDLHIELTGRVTTTPLTLHALMRYTDVNNWIAAQLFIPTTAADVTAIITNRVSGTSTQIVTADPGSASPNTDYKITAIISNTGIRCRLRVFIDDVLQLDYTDSSSPDIGTNNPTGTKFGIRVPVNSLYTLCRMYL